MEVISDLCSCGSEQEYMFARENTEPSMTLPLFWIKLGVDGKYYAIFETGYDLFEFDLLKPEVFKGLPIAHYGDYENAFELGRLH